MPKIDAAWMKLYYKLQRIKHGDYMPDASLRVRRAIIRRNGEVLTFIQQCQSGEREWFSGSVGALVHWLIDNGHVKP